MLIRAISDSWVLAVWLVGVSDKAQAAPSGSLRCLAVVITDCGPAASSCPIVVPSLIIGASPPMLSSTCQCYFA